MTKTKSLTIAIPLYNESETIKQLKQKLLETINNIEKTELKILLVDDGSTDNTFELLFKEFSDIGYFEIIQHEKNLNLDGFIKTILTRCDTEFVVFLDSDCTFEPEYILDMLPLINSDIDVVNGSPYHPNGDIEGVKKGRLLISNGANYIYRFLIDKNIYTYTSIFKLYRTSKIKNIEITTKGFVSVSELFIKSILNGARVTEFPCVLKIREYGDSKIRIFNSIKNHILFMTKLFFKKIS